MTKCNFLLNLIFLICFSFIANFSFSQNINIEVIQNTPSCWNVCCGETVVQATGDNPPFSYQWSNGEVGTGIYNVMPGIYSVTVTDATESTAETSITIENLDVIHEVFEFIPQSCFGINDVVLKDSVALGLPPFLYRIYDEQDSLLVFSGSIEDSTFLYENLAGDETYRVVMTDSRTCESEVIITTDGRNEFLVSAGEDITIDVGETTELLVATNYLAISYEWFPSDGLSCTDCPNPIVTGIENICYEVEVANEFACKARDTICVYTDFASNIDFLNESNPIQVFPNPVNNILTLKGKFNHNPSLKIINAQGKDVSIKSILKERNSIQIDVQNLPIGVYFISIKDDKDLSHQYIRFLKI